MNENEKEPGKDYVLDDQIGYILRLAFQYHTAIFTSMMIEGLTQTQYATLSKIHQIGSCSQSDLCKLIELDSATVNGVVTRMRTRGFIAFSEDPTDKRRQILSLSVEGKALMEEAESVGKSITDETLTNLSATERARLTALLRKMMEGRQAQRGKGLVDERDDREFVKRWASDRT